MKYRFVLISNDKMDLSLISEYLAFTMHGLESSDGKKR